MAETTTNQPHRERLHRLVCGCFEDTCPRRIEADKALAQAWAEGVDACHDRHGTLRALVNPYDPAPDGHGHG